MMLQVPASSPWRFWCLVQGLGPWCGCGLLHADCLVSGALLCYRWLGHLVTIVKGRLGVFSHPISSHSKWLVDGTDHSNPFFPTHVRFSTCQCPWISGSLTRQWWSSRFPQLQSVLQPDNEHGQKNGQNQLAKCSRQQFYLAPTYTCQAVSDSVHFSYQEADCGERVFWTFGLYVYYI